MSKVALTLEAVKEQFCTADKREALEQMADQLESVWDIDKAAELTVKIGDKHEQMHDQSEVERAELIMPIIRLLNMADTKALRCIYHFALHLVRGSEREDQV